MSDASYQPKTYRKSGGDVSVVADGGILSIESGGHIEIDTGGDILVNGVSLIDEVAALSGLDSGELGVLNAVTAGTVAASKALVVGASKQLSELGVVQFGNGSGGTTVALLHGSGLSSDPTTTATADKNFLGYWTKSTAATGDCRGMYLRTYFGGAGSGEALRAYATISFAGAAAVGGTINGAHVSLSINDGATVSGQASAARFTLDYAAATRTTDANVSCLLLCSNIAAGNTVHANNAFVRVVDDGAVPLQKLLRLPTVASAGLLAVHTTDAITHSIRCVDEAGPVFYIMATTTASNRTGGA